MEINRATTLAKVLVRDRALEARDRMDEALKSQKLADHEAFPGSAKFPEAIEVIVKYLSDLVEAKVSSIQDAYRQTGIALTGDAVDESVTALRSSLDSVVSARLKSWQAFVELLETRTNTKVAQSEAALHEASRRLNAEVAKLLERAECKLDVMLQTSLASAEKASGAADSLPRAPRTATVIRVLIASPGDVQKERDVLTDVVHAWNAANFAATGVLLLATKWETHAYPASGDRPQAIINKQIVDDSDILLGAFWCRLGTPTAVSASGTAEEIERLRARGKKVLLYFSTAPPPPGHDIRQLDLLKDYQHSLEKDTLYWNFADCDELYRSSSRHLSTVMHNLIAELKDDFGIESQSKPPAGAPGDTPLPQSGGTVPHMRVTGLGHVRIAPLGTSGQWIASDGGQIALAMQFTNEASRNASMNAEATVKSTLIYSIAGKEVLRVRGCWLDGFDLPTFQADDSHSLIVALAGREELSVLGTVRKLVAPGSEEIQIRAHRLLAISLEIQVRVRLTEADRGDLLYEGEFVIRRDPLQIARL